MERGSSFGSYNESDWEFYKKKRKSKESPKVLHLTAGMSGEYYNDDGLIILAPSPELIQDANSTKEYNDASYVILYKVGNKKIIFSGDSGEKTWDFILDNYKSLVTNVDVLLAPHHGRNSGGNDSYLDVLMPRLTLFGNAKSKYLDYDSWNRRNLNHITNNQCGNIVLDINTGIDIYVSNENFAKNFESYFWESRYNAFHIARI